MKKLDIIITHYKEPESVVKCLLDSIAIQENVDNFRVIIVNDGEDFVLKDSFLKKYNFEIKYVKKEKRGVSSARNKGMDISDAEYIMFCDCDDMFFSSLGLFTIYEEFSKGEFDLLVPKFKEEIRREDGSPTYINHDCDDNTFIHGKVYRRQYIIDIGLRWQEDINAHEDLYFNCLAAASSRNVRRINNCFYLWKYNKDSVTRVTDNFVLDTCIELIESYDRLVDGLKKINDKRNARINVLNLVLRLYQDIEWRVDSEKEKKAYERFGDFLLKHEEDYYSCNIIEKKEIVSIIGCQFYFDNTNFLNFVKTLLDNAKKRVII